MAETVKNLAVLGATGSIGTQTLDVVRALPGRFKVVALAAGRNTDLLLRQVKEFRPAYVYCADDSKEFRDKLKALGCQLISLEEMAAHPEIDVVVAATSGTAGLSAVLAAVRAGKRVALANKESLVVAGEIIMAEAARSSARIIPVDSEHSAVFQCLAGEAGPPRRIVLTASGGPFRTLTPQQMAAVTPAQALAHPSWRMGKKVTVDSATLMNKGLEVIEAHWLFNIPVEDIKVLIHPPSIVHSMVEFADGAVKAQLGRPDMRLPIQYALTYPDRLANDILPALDWANFDDLAFEPPDLERFPCLRLGIEAGRQGGTCPAALVAADEVAVASFLEGRIGFTNIAAIIEGVLENHQNMAHPALEQIIEAENRARQAARKLTAGDAG
jgi:1-deoxy-D-xylulose-5-phosphate reductoisomerase